MSGGLRTGLPMGWRGNLFTKEEFRLWFNPEEWKTWNPGKKPIVRVPVERQVPNEADL